MPVVVRADVPVADVDAANGYSQDVPVSWPTTHSFRSFRKCWSRHDDPGQLVALRARASMDAMELRPTVGRLPIANGAK